MIISLKKSSFEDKRLLFEHLNNKQVAITVASGRTVVCFSGSVFEVVGSNVRFIFSDDSKIGAIPLRRIRALALA